MPLPRLLVFDLDGTLIDSSLDLCNSINAMLAHLGRPALDNPTIAGYVGDGAATLVRRALNNPTEAEFQTALDYFLAWYRIHKLDNTLTYPGVLEALTTIRASHPAILMAVLTNKPVNPSRAICDALNLTPFFFQNYGGNSFPTKKPDPQGIFTLIAEANTILAQRSQPTLQPDEAFMIGDSDVDILTGRNAGVHTLGCTFGLKPESLIASAPDALVHHPSDWPTALGF